MSCLKTLCVVAFLASAVCANWNQESPRIPPNAKDIHILQHAPSSLDEEFKDNSKAWIRGKPFPKRPADWLKYHALQQAPSVEELTVQKLEDMSLEEGSKALETLYHVSQINNDLKPTYVPSPSSIPVHIVGANDQKVSTTLDKFANTAQKVANFGQQEITIFITGLPAQTETVSKSNHNLEQAYKERYNNEIQGTFVIIDLGEKLNNPKRYVLLDIDEVGSMVGEQLVQLVEKCKVPHEIVHILGQNVGAHVAGAAGKEFKRQTGKSIRRITGLDPSKVYAKHSNKLTGLARGNAEFIDAIHTSANGMGTRDRVGNVDIFPGGPSKGVPGAKNVIDASMRATDYFAESVRPGNEHNFPAVMADSFESYNSNNGYGRRAYVGIDLDKDLEGDYFLNVQETSPYGVRAPAVYQKGYHNIHKSLSSPSQNVLDFD